MSLFIEVHKSEADRLRARDVFIRRAQIMGIPATELMTPERIGEIFDAKWPPREESTQLPLPLHLAEDVVAG